MSQQHIALSAERASFRAKFNVRLVTPKESGSSIHRLPGGVFGFTGAPSTNEMPVFPVPSYQYFELVKSAVGDLHYIGYVTAREAEALAAGSEQLKINLYPEPFAESSTLIALPDSRVDRKRNPTRENGNAMPLDVAPAV
jgi:hypothetical protein